MRLLEGEIPPLQNEDGFLLSEGQLVLLQNEIGF
jgi:hypothetical protein